GARAGVARRAARARPRGGHGPASWGDRTPVAALSATGVGGSRPRSWHRGGTRPDPRPGRGPSTPPERSATRPTPPPPARSPRRPPPRQEPAALPRPRPARPARAAPR